MSHPWRGPHVAPRVRWVGAHRTALPLGRVHLRGAAVIVEGSSLRHFSANYNICGGRENASKVTEEEEFRPSRPGGSPRPRRGRASCRKCSRRRSRRRRLRPSCRRRLGHRRRLRKGPPLGRRLSLLRRSCLESERERPQSASKLREIASAVLCGFTRFQYLVYLAVIVVLVLAGAVIVVVVAVLLRHRVLRVRRRRRLGVGVGRSRRRRLCICPRLRLGARPGSRGGQEELGSAAFNRAPLYSRRLCLKETQADTFSA